MNEGEKEEEEKKIKQIQQALMQLWGRNGK